MVPTLRAPKLQEPVMSPLAQLEDALSRSCGLDPSRSEPT